MNKIIISLIAGLTLGLLLAPASGADTRKKLADRFRELTEDEDESFDRVPSMGDRIRGVRNAGGEFPGTVDATLI